MIFDFLHNLSLHPWIGTIALLLSYPFSYSIILLLLIWAVFFSERKMFTFSLLFLSGVCSWFVASTLKLLFHTNRPFINEHFTPLYTETGFSFPSQHAAIFATLAISMFLIDRRLGIAMSVIAFLIGVSRVVIGVHYPFDIIGGWCVGILIGFFITRIFKKI